MSHQAGVIEIRLLLQMFEQPAKCRGFDLGAVHGECWHAR
jgi:hypothetical protein